VSTWSLVYAWIVVIRPLTTPILSCNGFTSGTRQLVVHDALEITVSEALSVVWLTPYTTVASTSLPPGAEITTFLAPPLRCAEAFSLVVNNPVLSSTTSTPSAVHGSSAGFFCARTLMRSPFTNTAWSSTSTLPGNVRSAGRCYGSIGVLQ